MEGLAGHVPPTSTPIRTMFDVPAMVDISVEKKVTVLKIA